VAEREAWVARVRDELENPSLYLTPDGGVRAMQLGEELETARRELDRALEQWERASEAVGRFTALPPSRPPA
jgi:hypothetical protein